MSRSRQILTGVICVLLLLFLLQMVNVAFFKDKETELPSFDAIQSVQDNLPPPTGGLAEAKHKDIAMQLVSSAENSSTDWRAQYKYIEDIGDGRGYTAGIVGFCSGTGDMIIVIERYTQLQSKNELVKFLPALRKVNGTDSHAGLGRKFEKAWQDAAANKLFQQAQNDVRDLLYFNPAVRLAQSDNLSTLGQFMYYDAAVVHGADEWGGGLPDIRNRALEHAKSPAQGGDETAYLKAFLTERDVEMKKEDSHRDLSRINDIQRVFLGKRMFELNPPLQWKVYGDSYSIK